MWLLLLCIWLNVRLCEAQQESSNLSFLTPNRDEMIGFFFPHFTPYVDMMDLVLRASEFGFPSYLRRTQVLPDSFVFGIPQEMFSAPLGPIEFHIPTYVKQLIHLAKVKSGRLQTADDDEEGLVEATREIWLKSVRPAGFEDFIKARALRLLMYQDYPLMDDQMGGRIGLFNAPLVNSYIYQSNSSQNIPLAIIAMSGWRLLFWTAVSQMPNFYNGVHGQQPEDHITSIRAPSRLDELSSTFIFHLCVEMRRDKSLLQSDIPEGFCPNPCATSPCLTLPHATGQKCHLTGYGLFINDFRCECLPGYKWVSNAGFSDIEKSKGIEEVEETEEAKKEEEGDEEYTVRTPLSDEIGSCVPVDICESYCSSLGTRRCDVISGTRTAVCVCKLNYMGPTCNTQRDPCIELSNKEKMPGNLACNTGQGGQCIPAIGSDFYECRCPPVWTKDDSLDFENCLALKDKCTSEVCVRGDCISSPDGSNAICLCPEEAYGERCENLRGDWGEWSPWSACTPACGNGKIRKRERVRGCLYGSTCSGGRPRQIEVCPENMPCPDELVTLGLGPEALAPHDVLQGGEATPTFDIQQAYALKHRRYSLFTQVMKLVFLMLCVFAVVSATIMFLYAILY